MATMVNEEQLRAQFADDPETTFEQLLKRETRLSNVTFDKSGAVLEADLNGLQRLAALYAKSGIVPRDFKENIASCAVAIQVSMRLGVPPFVVFENMHVIHGKPGFDAKFVIGLANSSPAIRGRIRWRKADCPPSSPKFWCEAWCIDAETGDEVTGERITWDLVKAEGWLDKAGSKWKTMPGLMFQYRAGSWLINANYPELKLGLQTTDEIEDVDGYTQTEGQEAGTTPQQDAQPGTEAQAGRLFDTNQSMGGE